MGRGARGREERGGGMIWSGSFLSVVQGSSQAHRGADVDEILLGGDLAGGVPRARAGARDGWMEKTSSTMGRRKNMHANECGY